MLAAEGLFRDGRRRRSPRDRDEEAVERFYRDARGARHAHRSAEQRVDVDAPRRHGCRLVESLAFEDAVGRASSADNRR